MLRILSLSSNSHKKVQFLYYFASLYDNLCSPLNEWLVFSLFKHQRLASVVLSTCLIDVRCSIHVEGFYFIKLSPGGFFEIF